MKIKLVPVFLIGLLLLQPFTTYALTSSETKQAWYEAKNQSREAQEAHRDAKIAWATDKTGENNQEVIESGKEALHAALNEVEAWLVWRKLEVEENPEIPDGLKKAILDDVEANLGKIDEIREEIDGVENRLELGLVFLKMVGKYLELLADVARNTGYVWVHIANTYADTVEEYEAKLREAAQGIADNDEIVVKLDLALSDLESARENILNAEEEYQQVTIPGSPILKFANGNQYLRIAKNDLISAQTNLKQVFRLIAGTD
ncbi:hypothetical protein ACFL0D_02235 [Thermoproteota archaeon]